MNEVAYATALVLAAVFAWAGAVKLADRRRTAATFAGLGLPGPAVLAGAVPAAELVLAAGFVVVPRAAAAVSLVLLAAFTAVLVRAVRAGADVGCGCFGSARAEPVSGVEVLRNACLAGAAVVVLAGSEPAAPGVEAVVLVGTAVAVVAVVLALADLRRRTGHLLSVDLRHGPAAPGDG